MLASASNRGRRWRIVAYLLLMVAGVALAISSELLHTAPRWLWYVLSLFLLVGGGLSIWGQAKRRWTGEFTGLPLVWSSMAAFSVIQAFSIPLRENPLVIVLGVANCSLLLAFTAIALARWVDVSAVYRAAKEHADAQR